MHHLLREFHIDPPATPQSVIMIGDFGKDLDDEHALVLAAGLQRLGLIDLRAVVANLAPAEERARLAKGTLMELELPNVPVGIGSPVTHRTKPYPYEFDAPYIAPISTLAGDGHDLLVTTLRNTTPKSITLVLHSGLTDAARLLRQEETLCAEKLNRVVIMGGVAYTHATNDREPKRQPTPLLPNNAFDPSAATYVYEELQYRGIPMTVVTRDAAYACQIPLTMYDHMTATGHRVGIALADRQMHMLREYWRTVKLPAGHPDHGTLPPDRNRTWFVRVFCEGNDPGNAEDIASHVRVWNAYDPLALIAAVDALNGNFFDPWKFRLGNAVNGIIGIAPDEHHVIDPPDVVAFLCDVEDFALRAALAEHRAA